MWSMQQQETSSMGHAILEAGMPPFFELGQKPEIWGIPPNGAVTGSKLVGAKPVISENFPNRAVAGSKLVGAKTCNIGKFPN